MNFKQASEKLKTTKGVFQFELSELFGLYVEYRTGQSGASLTGEGSEYLNEFKLVLEEMLSDVKLNPN